MKFIRHFMILLLVLPQISLGQTETGAPDLDPALLEQSGPPAPPPMPGEITPEPQEPGAVAPTKAKKSSMKNKKKENKSKKSAKINKKNKKQKTSSKNKKKKTKKQTNK